LPIEFVAHRGQFVLVQQVLQHGDAVTAGGFDDSLILSTIADPRQTDHVATQ
jgi:hypothetical protein